MTPPVPKQTKASAIAKAALHLFAERGVAGATTRAIAQRARTAEGNIYRYYANKDDLARKVMTSCLVDFGEFLARALAGVHGSRARLATFVRAYLEYARTKPLEHDLVIESHGRHLVQLPEDLLRPRRILLELIGEGIADGTFVPGDPNTIAAFVAGGLARVASTDRLVAPERPFTTFASDLVRVVDRFVCKEAAPS